ncbi:hypothetical protein MHU86_25942 [Fragilaria crotonensis]|nr:hypothetical protein MHU86_25942 [Fragilaria crotonensis]
MPSNTPPPPPRDDRSTHNTHLSFQGLSAVARQNLLMQMLATRQQEQGRLFDNQQRVPTGGDDGAMIPNLNESVTRHHFQQQLGSLPHQQLQHDNTNTHHDMRSFGVLPRNAAVGMPHEFSPQLHTLDTSELQVSNMSFHGSNLQHTSLGQLPHRYNNPHQDQADNNMLNMMFMANQQVITPPFAGHHFNASEREDSSLSNNSDMLQAYNQSLTSLIASSNNPQQQQHFGDGPSMPSDGQESRSQMTGTRQSMHHFSNSPMYHGSSQQGHIRGIQQMYHFSEGVGPIDVPDRIVPTGIRSAMLGQGLPDIPFGPRQENFLNFGVDEKRPRDVDAWEAPKRKKRRSQRKQPLDKPRRALSAYNLFFSAERTRILREIDVQEGGLNVNPDVSTGGEETESCRALERPLVPSEVKRRPHRKTHGKIGFQTLAQTVARRWKQLSAEQKKYYQDLADEDLLRHKDAMEEYFTKQAGEKSGSVTELEEKR